MISIHHSTYKIQNDKQKLLTSFDGDPVGTFDGLEEGEVDGSFVSSGTGWPGSIGSGEDGLEVGDWLGF